MKYYELTCLISPDLSEEELKVFSQKLSNFILDEKGKLEKITVPIKRKLGYPIKGEKEAFLVTLNFSFQPTADSQQETEYSEKLKNLEKRLKSDSQILRYIILKKKISEKVPALNIKRITKKITEPSKSKVHRPKVEKVELKDIDKKIEEILGE